MTPGSAGSGDPDPLHDLELLLRSRHAIVHLETLEEDRAESLLLHLADRLDLPLFGWSPTKGLKRSDKPAPIYETADPARALAHVESARFPAVYHFRGLGPTLAADPLLRQRLLDAATPYAKIAGAVILTGTDVEIDDVLRPHVASVRLPPPDEQELRALLMHILRDMNARGSVEVDQTPEETNRLLRNLRGLTLLEAEKILTKAIVEDGRLSPEDIAAVVDAKR
ncbi:MAG: hypothetical protein R3266_13815, partial [Gemmatimonadota bacterium]|nr:hypothetical protein [Gemmatimonadota bacterium]